MSLSPENPAEATRIIHQALDLGINYFDTADLYNQGRNEAMVGQALAGVRDQVIIATKVGNQWRPDGSGWDWNPKKDYILRAIDDSLRRLKTDYIDVYQLHGGTLQDPMDETIEAFEQLQKTGKIRFYGLSSIRPNVIREYVQRSNIVSVMMQYSLLDRRPEEASLTLLAEHDIAVLARGSVAGGLLLDKPAAPYLQYTADDVTAVVQALHREAGQAVLGTALGYVLHTPAVCSAVLGIRTVDQLQEMAQATTHLPLSAEVMKRLQQVRPALQYLEHR